MATPTEGEKLMTGSTGQVGTVLLSPTKWNNLSILARINVNVLRAISIQCVMVEYRRGQLTAASG